MRAGDVRLMDMRQAVGDVRLIMDMRQAFIAVATMYTYAYIILSHLAELKRSTCIVNARNLKHPTLVTRSFNCEFQCYT